MLKLVAFWSSETLRGAGYALQIVWHPIVYVTPSYCGGHMITDKVWKQDRVPQLAVVHMSACYIRTISHRLTSLYIHRSESN